ncbi:MULTISPECIES: hypothetical protein [unclassified Burkholderia]|uniref:hypothetical protein n=1 Tax=unclassified Burkholderia TaxID=2613784 RepID=UPI000752437C|nr:MULTISPECIES: hypothetical protein [unclassified Burkholderia]KVN02530.1 hypothetical protein WT08_24695 [Burkholderia sp. MSMB1552]KWZ50937.1 hypothetical protein WS92_26770 [Burkholderia sp. MSMB1588]
MAASIAREGSNGSDDSHFVAITSPHGLEIATIDALGASGNVKRSGDSVIRTPLRRRMLSSKTIADTGARAFDTIAKTRGHRLLQSRLIFQ